MALSHFLRQTPHFYFFCCFVPFAKLFSLKSIFDCHFFGFVSTFHRSIQFGNCFVNKILHVTKNLEENIFEFSENSNNSEKSREKLEKVRLNYETLQVLLVLYLPVFKRIFRKLFSDTLPVDLCEETRVSLGHWLRLFRLMYRKIFT